MKRAIGLIILIAAFVMGFLSIRGSLPFMPIFGHSMEPTLHSGSLLMIEPIDPYQVKVDDIIVYNVPKLIRDYYNYPPVVSHRVIKVTNDRGVLSFRTKGDNTGEDPFSIRPNDIRGTVGDQIPYLGLPLLFFQSQQGMIFVIIALVVLAIFLYSDELSLGQHKAHRGIFSPVIQETARTNRVLSQKMETNEHKIEATEQALVKFAGAIEEYAHHLASHTSAIQGLAEASHELKRGAAEQNKVLINVMQALDEKRFQRTNTDYVQTPPEAMVIPVRREEPKARIEAAPAPRARKPEIKSNLEETLAFIDQSRTSSGTGAYPPGCFRCKKQQPTTQTAGKEPSKNAETTRKV
ncbi:MAG: signal peptidase I [Dehalococcoidales bacterium]|nr:signal peptidase I [Dehalococcoidales bacterium]